MAQTDMLKRYLDAGIAFTQLTQQKAEGIVRELVKAGEVQTNQAQARVQELLDRNRENIEALTQLIAAEVRSQLANVGVGKKPAAKKAAAPAPAAKAAPRKVPATRTAVKKTGTPAKKAVKKTATPAKKAAKKA